MDNPLGKMHEEQMRQFGVNASAWKNMINEQFLMGHPITDQTHIDHRKAWENGPMETMMAQNLALTAFDRQDKLFSLHHQKGAVRSHGAHPIGMSLSSEIPHPTHPEQTSFFLATSLLEGQPDYAKINAAMQRAESMDPERVNRRFPGSEFFNRAPFQSFRYSE